MIDAPSAERRQHRRIPRVVNVEIEHPAAGCNIPARTLDISDGGMLVSVPPTAPVTEGQPVSIRASQNALPRLPKNSDPSSRETLDATIVRVDRNALLASGQLQVGIKLESRCHFLAG